MEINKQLFEDVLSGKLKGTFVLRNKRKISSNKLICNNSYYSETHPYRLVSVTYTSNGFSSLYGSEHLDDIINFIPDIDMKENELTIEIPNDKIIDWDESKKQNKIILKNKQLTYKDICEKLFNDDHYTIAWEGYPIECCSAIYCASNATTEHQLECILAKNQLANVAVYLNDGWKPTISTNDFGHFIFRNGNYNDFCIKECDDYMHDNNVLFKTRELAQRAIEILGEETVKLALEPLGI